MNALGPWTSVFMFRIVFSRRQKGYAEGLRNGLSHIRVPNDLFLKRMPSSPAEYRR